MERVKFIIFSGREKLALITDRLGKGKIIIIDFCRRKRVRIDPLFSVKKGLTISSVLLVYTNYTQINFYWEGIGQEGKRLNLNWKGGKRFKIITNF